jgi:hypothetical protein
MNDVVSCTSLGGINIRMLGFVIQVIIYILRSLGNGRGSRVISRGS